MSDIQMLESLSVEELRAELAAREAKTKGALAMPASESLAHITSATIVEVLRAQQKVIYDVDDRQDVWELANTDPKKLKADSVVALFQASRITDNGNGTSTLQTTKFQTARNLCPEEPFAEQPVGAFCTGFLVATDIVATAGHCANESNVTDVRFVFGFEMENETKARFIIDNNEIYRGIKIIGRQQVGTGEDWALIRIDRPATNHPVLQIRRSTKITDNQSVYVIGHPSGLPKKVAGGANVRKNDSSAFFVANTDTYGGNSGSPVFNADDHVVEGILVRGETDFVMHGNCNVSLVCPASGCRGEDCTRTSVFASLIP